MKTCSIHPEVFRSVLTEFKKIHDKYPEIEGNKKWKMAKDLVYAMSLADTALMKQEMGL